MLPDRWGPDRQPALNLPGARPLASATFRDGVLVVSHANIKSNRDTRRGTKYNRDCVVTYVDSGALVTKRVPLPGTYGALVEALELRVNPGNLRGCGRA